MKVTVIEPADRVGVRVCHEGAVYRPGETADVPDDVAQSWVAAGWVKALAGSSASRRPKAADTEQPEAHGELDR